MRMIQSTSSGHAKDYFVAGLERADYYTADTAQERQGVFKGKLAERLGISGAADKKTFFALCDNINPKTGKPLTPVTRDERLTGWDFNWHAPKSVSVLHALAQDDHILNAFQSAVTETMQDIEADSKTRVRRGGVYDDRNTGNLIWSEFIHETARPTKGHPPDMHLHCHAFCWNASFDEVENRIKAAKWRDVKKDAPLYQQLFHKRLADKMIDLGYSIRRTDNAFEIEGVPQKMIDFYSKRKSEIERVAKEKGITDAKQLDALGAKTRAKKQKGLTMKELKANWRLQMKLLTDDKDGGTPIRYAPVKDIAKQEPGQTVDFALQDCYERVSVMDERRVLRSAIRHAVGHRDISIDEIKKQFAQDQRIIRIKQGSRTLCTTKEVLAEEMKMVGLAQAGQGKLAPLYGGVPHFDKLKDQQAAAATHVLTTKNRVSIVMGAAGTGKTTLMLETVEKIEKLGKKVMTVAPTAEAARVLKEEGFDKADTVAKLLVDKKMQDQLKDQVLWVDEAGLLGTKDMTELLILADQKNARLILGGDTRQHNSVIRGDALRVLNTTGKIKAAEVSKIHRQKNLDYRSAIEDFAKGQVKEGFEKLDAIGAIKTVDHLDPNTQLVNDYVAAVKKGKSALIVSPTHKQGDEVTAAIRVKLREEGKIGHKEVSAARLINLNMTEAQKGDFRNFNEGQLVQFNQHVKGIKRGSMWAVKTVRDGKIEISDKQGATRILPCKTAAKYDVYQKSEIGLSKGDKVRVTRNGFADKKKRLNNGMALEVISVEKDGKINLRSRDGKTSYTVGNDFGHIAHAHVVTSYASQGKTVDHVFISQPSATFAATDAKTLYVSASRGKQSVSIYTDDKAELLAHASEMGNRQSALELVGKDDVHFRIVQQLQRKDYAAPNKTVEKQKSLSPEKYAKDIDYEPGL